MGIQKAMANPEEEPHVRNLYVTVGVYLGYALAQYKEFYSIDHVMILGRVSKGKGGDLMLETEFPGLPPVKFHTADDHFKAVGQCIAAAALPSLRPRNSTLSQMLKIAPTWMCCAPSQN